MFSFSFNININLKNFKYGRS